MTRQLRRITSRPRRYIVEEERRGIPVHGLQGSLKVLSKSNCTGVEVVENAVERTVILRVIARKMETTEAMLM